MYVHGGVCAWGVSAWEGALQGVRGGGCARGLCVVYTSLGDVCVMLCVHGGVCVRGV